MTKTNLEEIYYLNSPQALGFTVCLSIILAIGNTPWDLKSEIISVFAILFYIFGTIITIKRCLFEEDNNERK